MDGCQVRKDGGRTGQYVCQVGENGRTGPGKIPEVLNNEHEVTHRTEPVGNMQYELRSYIHETQNRAVPVR